MSVDGALVVDKPAGMTSHDVVAAARRLLRETRIGHAGTLDPFATGVLVLVCGRATRLARFLSASDKSYDATVRFGLTTDTYDSTGVETSRSADRPDRAAIEAALPSLRGEYLQTPPPYSARKVAGVRAYTLARRQEAVTLAPTAVRVTQADLIALSGDTAEFAIVSSAGFYVRSFAHDLGAQLGCGACLSALRRTRSGEFTLTDAVTLDTVAARGAALVRPVDGLLTWMPAATLTTRGVERVRHGQAVGPADLAGPVPAGADQGEWVRLLSPDRRLVALAQPAPGALHPSVVLN